EYLVMAAELARVKSRVLLPAAPAEATGEEGEDPRAELTRRLMEYQRFKNASAELRRKEEARQKVFPPRAEPLDEMKGDETLTDATVFDLFRAFREILDEKRERQDFEVQITNLSVTDRIQYLLDIVNTAESVAFNHLFNSANTRQEIIVTFLALLEIMRLKLVRVQQTGHFETIRVYPAADVQAQKEALAAYQESPAE
ncbi:MAG: segregation and condensation protein A, partial [Nitrospinaceae bacterium]